MNEIIGQYLSLQSFLAFIFAVFILTLSHYD